MKQNPNQKLVYSFFVLISLVSNSVFSQSSTVTVGLGPTSQNVNLGLYGDKTVTQINLTCMTAASRYYWEIDGPWQTTTGLTNSFSTTTNTISIVTLPGYAGCESGSVSVSNTGTQQLSNDKKPMDASASISSFSYIVGISHAQPFVRVIWQSNTLANCYVMNVSSSAIYNLGLSPAPTSYVTFSPTSNQTNGLAAIVSTTVTPLPPGFMYSGSFVDNVAVAGSSNCTITLQHPVNIAVAQTFEANGVGGTDGGGGDDCIEVETEYGTTTVCAHYTSTLKLYPNPAVSEVTVESDDPGNVTISLYSQLGTLVATQNDVPSNYKWDVSGMPDGLYFIKVSQGDKTSVERILIRK